MKVPVGFLITVSVILLLSSCVRIIYIGRRIEPEIILEKEHHNIDFVNLFDYTLPVNAKKKDEVSYHEGVMGLSEGLSSFSNDSSFSYIVGDTLKKGIGNGLLTALLPADSVTAICNRDNSNMLLTLDSMSVFFDLKSIAGKNDTLNKSKTTNLYLNSKFFMSLYSLSGDLINRSELDQSELYRYGPLFSEIIMEKQPVANAGDEVGALAFQAGQDYVSKFYPQIIQDTRQLYTGKYFRESNSYIFARNWNKATELLEQLVKNPDPVISGKARYNLEVVKEASKADAR